MKKIELTDGVSKSVVETKPNNAINSLKDEIKKLCNQNELSYKQKNIALYLADKELYEEVIGEGL